MESVPAGVPSRGSWPIGLLSRVVQVDGSLAEHATELTSTEELRSLDALHLAAALLIVSPELTFATWDVRLRGAAQRQSLAVFPQRSEPGFSDQRQGELNAG